MVFYFRTIVKFVVMWYRWAFQKYTFLSIAQNIQKLSFSISEFPCGLEYNSIDDLRALEKQHSRILMCNLRHHLPIILLSLTMSSALGLGCEKTMRRYLQFMSNLARTRILAIIKYLGLVSKPTRKTLLLGKNR